MERDITTAIFHCLAQSDAAAIPSDSAKRHEALLTAAHMLCTCKSLVHESQCVLPAPRLLEYAVDSIMYRHACCTTSVFEQRAPYDWSMSYVHNDAYLDTYFPDVFPGLTATFRFPGADDGAQREASVDLCYTPGPHGGGFMYQPRLRLVGLAPSERRGGLLSEACGMLRSVAPIIGVQQHVQADRLSQAELQSAFPWRASRVDPENDVHDANLVLREFCDYTSLLQQPPRGGSSMRLSSDPGDQGTVVLRLLLRPGAAFDTVARLRAQLGPAQWRAHGGSECLGSMPPLSHSHLGRQAASLEARRRLTARLVSIARALERCA